MLLKHDFSSLRLSARHCSFCYGRFLLFKISRTPPISPFSVNTTFSEDLKQQSEQPVTPAVCTRREEQMYCEGCGGHKRRKPSTFLHRCALPDLKDTLASGVNKQHKLSTLIPKEQEENSDEVNTVIPTTLQQPRNRRASEPETGSYHSGTAPLALWLFGKKKQKTEKTKHTHTKKVTRATHYFLPVERHPQAPRCQRPPGNEPTQHLVSSNERVRGVLSTPTHDTHTTLDSHT